MVPSLINECVVGDQILQPAEGCSVEALLLNQQAKITYGLVVAAIILGGPAAWFVAVDRSWFVDECPDCGYYADVTQYRVLTVPISEQVSAHPTVIQGIAADLGHPCWHPRLLRWHKHRWWGLCHCAAPCWNGTYGLNDDADHAWYGTVASRVCEMGEDNPELGRVWYDRVIVGHDWSFWHAFAEDLDAIAKNDHSGSE